MDTPGLSIRELDALFDQSPVAMVFTDREMRVRRANAAFRQLTGLPDEALIGRRPSEYDMADRVMDMDLIERTIAGQVIGAGVPVVNMQLEQILAGAGERRVFSWTAYRVTDNGRVLGAAGFLVDITASVKAAAALQEANTRLDLLQRAGSEIGTTLDIHRTAAELTALAVPQLADRAIVDLLDPVLRDEDPLSAGPDALRFRRVAVRDAATEAVVDFAVGDLITVPVARRQAAMFLRREPLLVRNRAGLRQSGLPPGHVQVLLDRGIHTLVRVPLTARGVTLGTAGFGRAEHPGPYDEADVRLFRELAARAAVMIDNARLYTREHDAAVTLQRSMLPRDILQVAGLDIAYRYQPASEAAEIGGDWFDVIPLDRGQVALVVGDVTGHGIRAAAIMGQLRTTTVALARLGCPPGQIMQQLSGLVAGHGDEAGATCLYAVYDPGSRRCRLASAGHPLPALRRPDGATEFIDLPPGLLLGAGPDRYLAIDRQLPAGSTLAMYTDGLIEEPGEDIGTGMSRLARALAAGPARSPDDLCDSVLATLAPRPRDDIALLLARTTTTPLPRR
ncbi:MAG TPA: SpoIIE family protein phosphatase [Trebonia sp.]|jgi:PAS domain S-box-containing protein|nr:SpoIIE family protein phosphatase [Trebonia sp.]